MLQSHSSSHARRHAIAQSLTQCTDPLCTQCRVPYMIGALCVVQVKQLAAALKENHSLIELELAQSPHNA